MSDDKTGGGRSQEPSESQSHRAARDLPTPPSRGLFRHPVSSGQNGFEEESSAHLRLVTASGHVSGSNGRNGSSRPRLSADVWEDLRRVAPGPLADTALDPDNCDDDPVAHSFDRLRTQMIQQLRENGWNRIAVASPTRGCGASFSAVNLALSFARVPGSRTVLLDLNLRRPGLSGIFDMPGRGEMRGFLNGSVRLRDHLVCISETLAVGLAAEPDPKAAHLLHSDCGAIVVNDLVDQVAPDILVCDMPPVLENDDLVGFLPQVDGVLLVADSSQTLPDHISACEQRLSGLTRFLGVILNQTHRSGPVPGFA